MEPAGESPVVAGAVLAPAVIACLLGVTAYPVQRTPPMVFVPSIRTALPGRLSTDNDENGLL